jgi:hypothetical protein
VLSLVVQGRALCSIVAQRGGLAHKKDWQSLVIMGGTRGIGHAIAQQFAKRERSDLRTVARGHRELHHRRFDGFLRRNAWPYIVSPDSETGTATATERSTRRRNRGHSN